eukprot:526295_1
MATADIVIAYFMFLLIPISIILGITNLIQFLRFCALRKHEFLQKRKPPLIIIYCIIALTSSMLTLPYISFVHIISTQHNPSTSSPISWINNIPKTSRTHMINTGWVFQFIHEISTCFLLILISIRSWCLYVDYRFAMASADFTNWRIHVNASETNIWIKYKKYLGNYKLILYIIAMLSLLILSIFFILHYTINLHLYGFMADFTIAVPVSIFIFWLYSKIKHTKDQFMIKNELKRLSICVLIIIFSFLIWIIKQGWIDTYNLYNTETVDIHLLMYTIDIIFVFYTVYVQTQWVINQFEKHLLSKKQKYNHSKKNNSTTKSSSKEIRMVDVLRSKEGFHAFVNHCVSEVNVEGVLFLVQVSQFKATITQFHRNELIESRNIDVVKENLHRILLNEKQHKATTTTTAGITGTTLTQLQEDCDAIASTSISRVSSLKKRVSAMVKGMPGIGTLNIETINSNPSIVSTHTIASNHSTSNITPYQMVDHSSDTVDNNKIQMKQRRSNTLQEDTFKKFQQDILERDWLPISNALKIENGGAEINININIEEEQVQVQQEQPQDFIKAVPEHLEIDKIETIIPEKIDTMITPPPSNENTPISTNTPIEKTIKFSQLKHLSIGEVHPNASGKLKYSPSTTTTSTNSPNKIYKGSPVTFSSHTNSITPKSKKQKPIPFPLITAEQKHSNDDTEEEKDDEKSFKKAPIKKRNIRMRESFKLMIKNKSVSSVETMKDTLSPNWMFKRLHNLYNKYIQMTGELSINLSGDSRSKLISFFSLKPEQAFELIRNHNYNDLTQIEKDIIENDNEYDILLIKTYLYHVFDVAFNDIWHLLRDDVFL